MLECLRELSQSGSALHGSLREKSRHLDDASGIHVHLSRMLAPHDFAVTGTNSGTVEGWHHSIDLDGVVLHYIDYRSSAESISVLVEKLQDGIMVKVPLRGRTTVIQSGREYPVGPNEFVVINASSPYRAVMPGDNRHLAMTLSHAWIGNYLGRQKLALRQQSLSFSHSAYCIDREGLMLAGVLTTLVGCLAQGDTALGSHGVATHVKELITSVVLGLSPEYRRASRDLAPRDGAPPYVHQAEFYIRDHLAEPIGIKEIARHAGASRRTLYAGFRKYRGTTPLALLKSMRLQAVMAALQQLSDGDRGVTRLAMTYGFYHLGRFSKDFKDMFGVLPSEVRRSAY
ncbi:AraC family transcriptional regulator [Paracoccus sp. MKU1]|uniref:AraC family transcriptional regulator n=1 Tax=Paracoccus sp. MKU1 TaxID=1745182 RepID=UPI0007191A97|nr:AraC family transcriptional regulator [Paracoccus sp. MKU1]KRW95218.1 hypothetical protein AQY21_15570 [Paracoccus sp. MKU1]